MKMKKVTALLLAATMTLGLVACGGTGSDKDKDNKGPNGGSNEQALDWSQAADASGGDVTIRFSTWRGADKEIFETLIDKFEKEYNWIDVELEINSNESSYYSNLQADLISNSAPDVFNIHASAYLSSFAEEGYITPQTDFDYLANYNSNALAASSLDGVNYGFLANYNYFGFLYNKDIFAKVGVEVPTTPDEMVAVVNKLKNAGYGGVMVAGKTWGEAYGRAILMNAIGADGYYKLRTGLDNGSITNIEEVEGVKEAFDTMQKYSENDIYYTAFEGTDATAGMSLFAQQKTAIVYGGTYLFGEQEYNFPGINAGYFPVPTYANTGISYAEGGETFVINSSSDKLGAAKLFVEFMAKAENLDEFNRITMKLSTISGTTWNFDEIQTHVKDYALKQNEKFDNVDYWSTGFSNILKSTVYDGIAWKDLNKVYKSQLEEYDLANK